MLVEIIFVNNLFKINLQFYFVYLEKSIIFYDFSHFIN